MLKPPGGFSVSDARSLPMEAPRHLRDFTAITEGHWVENNEGDGTLKLSIRSVGFKENHLQAIQTLGVQPSVFNL